MEAELATAVLNEAKNRKIFRGEVPEDESKRSTLAEQLVEAAKREHAGGARGEDIMSILNMAGEVTEDDGAATQHPPSAEQTQSAVQPGGPDEAGPTPEAGPARQALQRIASENLPIPPHIEGEPSEIPRDFTSADDRTIRRLHGEQNAFLVRTMWLVGVERADLQGAEHMLEYSRTQARKKVDRKNDDDTRKLADDITAEVESDADVIKWRDRVEQHRAAKEMLTALQYVYQSNVDRLSREWSMRTDEYERSGSR